MPFALEAGLTPRVPYGSCLDPELPMGEGEMEPCGKRIGPLP